MLSIHQVTGGYAGTPVVKNISFEVEKGELFGILGPNGSGKTTILKMLSGILPHKSGDILIKGKNLSQYTPKELAKIIAVLPQHSSQAFSYTVKETVSLGRYAHQKGWFQSWSGKDEEAVNRVMEQTGISHFRDYDIQQLSGGERQRVFLAQALAQEPEILLLDEPTNHLDLSYQKELLDLLSVWSKDCGLTVISIFHDLNLAGLYCDRLLLLENGEVNINHIPNEVLKESRIREVYRTKIEKLPHPRVPAPQMVLVPQRSQAESQSVNRIDQSSLEVKDDLLVICSPFPLKTMSSGVTGSGTGWNRIFLNRHVSKNYDCSDHRAEMADFVREIGFEPGETVGMMTAVYVEDHSSKFYEEGTFSVYVVVTAGVGNAVDASKSEAHSYHLTPGTINTWIFVNGNLTEESFIQCIMTATEAKTRALYDQKVKDAVTGTIATGTSTDSIMIAATQQGENLEYAGTITPLGKVIGKGVYECTVEAIKKSQRRIKR